MLNTDFDTLNDNNWQPQKNMVEFRDVDTYLEADDKFLSLKHQWENLKDSTAVIEKIISEINFRRNLFTSIIANQRFKNGLG